MFDISLLLAASKEIFFGISANRNQRLERHDYHDY
jgi:hypothetical protein